jgi:hypothetical protein
LADVVAGTLDAAGSLANEMPRKNLESALLDGFLMVLRSAFKSEFKPFGQRVVGWHAGHFAKECHELFGESTSTTLSLGTRHPRGDQ